MNRRKSTKNITISIEIKSKRELKNAMIPLDKPLMSDYNNFANHFIIILAQLSHHVNYKIVRTCGFITFFPVKKHRFASTDADLWQHYVRKEYTQMSHSEEKPCFSVRSAEPTIAPSEATAIFLACSGEEMPKPMAQGILVLVPSAPGRIGGQASFGEIDAVDCAC